MGVKEFGSLDNSLGAFRLYTSCSSFIHNMETCNYHVIIHEFKSVQSVVKVTQKAEPKVDVKVKARKYIQVNLKKQ